MRVVLCLVANSFVYDTLRGLARNLANKNQIENPRPESFRDS